MNRLSNIISKITTVLKNIDGTTQSSGYKYYTSTGTVDVYDEALSLEENTDPLMVNHIIDEDDNGINIQALSMGQHAYSLTTNIRIKSRVHIDLTSDTIRLDSSDKMNEVLSDMLFSFAKDISLGGTVDSITFLNAFKEYETTSNNIFYTCDLITTWMINYTCSTVNPNIPACSY